jgi:hypothetical protein
MMDQRGLKERQDLPEMTVLQGRWDQQVPMELQDLKEFREIRVLQGQMAAMA